MEEQLSVEVQFFEGCPNVAPAFELVKTVCDAVMPGIEVIKSEVATFKEAKAIGFLGSPSIRVDGRDIEGKRGPSNGLTYRVYEKSGVPPRWMIEAALLRALEPKGFLFLCVANSARSQMGEGVARKLAPAEVRVQSAGSRPTSVRPEAQKVLAEIGVDTSAHTSKHVNDISPETVDVVITLCAEEECTVFLGKAIRLHWGLPDPAAVVGNEETRLDAFRKTRDELVKRLGLVFAPCGGRWC
jgi:arsenate reductase